MLFIPAPSWDRCGKKEKKRRNYVRQDQTVTLEFRFTLHELYETYPGLTLLCHEINLLYTITNACFQELFCGSRFLFRQQRWHTTYNDVA